VSEALTKEVILKGIEEAKPLSDYASYKEQGYARQRADRLCGINLSRLVSLKSGRLLTVGRVQTAVLAAVSEREKEVADFKPQKYLEVTASLAKEGGAFSVKLSNKDNAEFPTRFPPDAPLLREVASHAATIKSGKITALSRERKTQKPPQLLNLTGLQKEASKKFSCSPETTLEIAQALYEKHKCLSYPRTPSRVMGDENVGLVRGIYEKVAASYPKEAEGTLPALIDGSNKRLFNSADLQDHHALIPLGPLPDEASEQERNIFSIVLARFFTALKSDYIYNAVKIEADIGGFTFQGSGAEVLQAGWKEANGGDEEREENYSGITEGETCPVASVTPEEKLTEPRKRHTASSLLSLMENPRGEDGGHLSGLGTPATRGSIIKKLFDRGYVSQKGKSVIPTQDGLFLIDNIKKNEALAAFVSIPETTRWEEQLHSETDKFLQSVKDFVRNAAANTSVERYREEKEVLGKCPLCGGDVYENRKSFSCANWNSKEKPCAFAIWKETCGAAVTEADAKLLLSWKTTKPKKCRSRAGKEFLAAFALENGKIAFKFQEGKK
jgi:DNA topoisomerase-3